MMIMTTNPEDIATENSATAKSSVHHEDVDEDEDEVGDEDEDKSNLVIKVI